MYCVEISIYAVFLSVANTGFSNDINVLEIESEKRYGQLQCADPKFVVDECSGHTLNLERKKPSKPCKNFKKKKCLRKCKFCTNYKSCKTCCKKWCIASTKTTKITGAATTIPTETTTTTAATTAFAEPPTSSPLPRPSTLSSITTTTATTTSPSPNLMREAFVLKQAWCAWFPCKSMKYYKSCCISMMVYCDGLNCSGNEQDPCPDGVWASLKTGCYRFVVADTFDQANKLCNRDGPGHLLELNSQQEQDELSKFYQDSGLCGQVFLGAKKENKEGEWMWLKSQEKLNFSSWGINQPDNAGGNETCLAWDGDKSWNDISCDQSNTTFLAICEAAEKMTSVNNTGSIEENNNGKNTDLPTCNCGLANTNNNRIVEGKETGKNEYPWQVGLVRRDENKPFCGGSIISTKTILSAAHCTYDGDVQQILVLIGEHDITNDTDGQEIRELEQIINHELFDNKTLDFDFSLLILKETLAWNKKVLPVCLPEAWSGFEGFQAVVSGWGNLEYNGTTSNTLQKARVFTLTNEACTRNTGYDTIQITNNMICATSNGKDSCYGDSGGPLVTQELYGYYYIIGIVSWGNQCGNSPGVYSRVSTWIVDNWIKPKILGQSCKKTDNCQMGWQHFGTKCYKLFPEPITNQSDAKAFCQNRGADIISLETKGEETFLENMLDQHLREGTLSRGIDIWLSARRNSTNTPFIWNTGNEITWADWRIGHPRDDHGGTALCIQIYKNYNPTWTWTSTNCDPDYDNAVVCEETPNEETCPMGWIISVAGCYKFVDSIDWNQGATNCKNAGGFLAEINNQEEQDAVWQIYREIGISMSAVWIGATDKAQEGTWLWNHTGEEMSFSAWLPNEPNGGIKENCIVAYIAWDFKWNDTPCDYQYENSKALCEVNRTG